MPYKSGGRGLREPVGPGTGRGGAGALGSRGDFIGGLLDMQSLLGGIGNHGAGRSMTKRSPSPKAAPKAAAAPAPKPKVRLSADPRRPSRLFGGGGMSDRGSLLSGAARPSYNL